MSWILSRPTLLAACVLSITAACAAVHDSVSPVDVLRREDVRLMVEPQAAGLKVGSDAWDPEPPEAAGPNLTLQVDLFLAKVDSIDAALGENAADLVGVACSRNQAERLCDELRAAGAEGVYDIVGSSKLSLHDGQRGYMSVAKQDAYVAGFEMVRHADQAIADPQVAVAQDGVLLSAKMHTATSGARSVDLELTICELDRPFHTRTIQLMHGAPPVTVQLPTGISRKLSLHSDLAPEEALVFGGTSLQVTRDGRALIAVLKVDAADNAP